MSRRVRTIATDATTDEAAVVLTVEGVGGAPVCDASGRVVGMISRADLTDPERWSAADDAHDGAERTIERIMTPGFVALHESDLVKDAVELMARDQLHRVLVFDDEGRLTGILTPTDVLRALLESSEEHATEEEEKDPITVH